jgi:group I intron endonuclease
MSIIYCHKNKINRKCYIGQTSRSIQDRVGTNPSKAYCNNTEFYGDIIKYGWENFETTILEVVEDDNDLNSRETYWINTFKQEGIQLYNKCLKGTSNFHKTILVSNRVTEEDRATIQKLFEEGKSLKEISECTGVSSVKSVLIDLGYEIPTQGNLCSFDKEQKEITSRFVDGLKCPICGNSFRKSHDMRRMLCSIQCRTSYLKMSKRERDRIKAIHNNNLHDYRLLRDNIRKEKDEYTCERCKIEEEVKEKRKEVISKKVEKVREERKPKHTAKELHWRKDDTRCKQKLDLILNSGVDLMKFGYSTKLCKMFPELSKRTVLFLLRKYNIPHFERVGSNITNLNL